MAGKPTPMSGTWGNVVELKRTVGIYRACFSQWVVSGVKQAYWLGPWDRGAIVIIQEVLGIKCVGLLEHELDCDETGEKRRDKKRKKSREETQREVKTRGAFCKGCPWRHVHSRGENNRS